MSAVDEALKVLETPEAEGGLSDYEKILAARIILRAAPLDVAAAVSVAAPAVAESAVVEAVAPAVGLAPAQ